jgi:hypothetical protein
MPKAIFPCVVGRRQNVSDTDKQEVVLSCEMLHVVSGCEKSDMAISK